MPGKPTFRKGLGRNARSRQSFGRSTPNPQEQLLGFYTGIVMDDIDDQRQGQIWVYIGGVSARRYSTAESTPSYGATAPDRDAPGAVLTWDQRLRLGWIQCYPLLPFFGGDDWRVQRSPDGDIRNARNGDVQTYGFWAQPRVGDHVGVLFANGDPQSAFWIGMVPDINRNFMVPGVAGRVPADLDEKKDLRDPDPQILRLQQQAAAGDIVSEASLKSRTFGAPIHPRTKQIKEEAPPASLVPVMDKTLRLSNDNRTPVEKPLTDVLVASEFAFNLQKAGLLCDPLRGASTSSARRESPSYVTGLKSPGWNFDSEKKNLNTAGGTETRFQDNPGPYATVATVGHQFVMDDHPDFQGMRMRTSAGHQVYLNDSCDDPFIYISTTQGRVWVELTESGKVNIFAEDSVSVHSRKDINMTADRDLNIDVQRDFKMQVRRNTEIAWKGQVDIEVGRNNLLPQRLAYDPAPTWGDASVPKDMFIRNFGNVDWSVDNDMKMTIGMDMDIAVETGEFKVETTSSPLNLKSGSTMHLESAGQMNLLATAGNIHLTGTTDIHLNGPPATPASSATEATDPIIKKNIQVSTAPTEVEIRNCVDPMKTFNTLDEATVPQHQPWSEACKINFLFAGFADEVPGDFVARVGATTDDAEEPLPKVQADGIFNGVPYSGTSQGEAPAYTLLRAVDPGDFNPCSTYTSSDRLIVFLKAEEGSRNKAYIDAGKFAIGFGHQINVGDTIFGDTINGVVTKEDLAFLRRSSGDLRIDDDEKERLLREDLVEFEAAVCDAVTTEITQGQFDALVSFAYNTGPRNVARVVESSNLNSGDFTNVPQRWMQYHRCTGCAPARRGIVEDVLRGRRRRELEQFFADSGDQTLETGAKSIADVV